MFERININNLTSDSQIDYGFLAEAMLFYGTTNVSANFGSIQGILGRFGPELLLEFLSNGFLTIKYESWGTGVYTEDSKSKSPRHFLTTYEIEQTDVLSVLSRILIEQSGRPGRSRRLARRLADHIDIVPQARGLGARVLSDIQSGSYLRDAYLAIIRRLAPTAPLPAMPILLPTFLEDNRISLDSNIDLNAVNEHYHKSVSPSSSTITPAFILGHLMEAQKALESAASGDAELAMLPVYSDVVKLRVSKALEGHARSQSELNEFQDFVFDESRAIAEAINRGERDLADLLPLLQKAQKFRKWVRDQKNDASLVKEYFRDSTADSWIDRLPSKSIRWSIFTGLGIALDAFGAGGAGTIAGVLLSAGDEFLLDRLVKGWKPNQFVNGPLKHFVDPGGHS